MNCLDRTAGADRVIKVNYARGLRGRFKAYDRVFKLLMFKKGQINRHSGFNAVHYRRHTVCSTESIQPSSVAGCRFWKRAAQPKAIPSREKVAKESSSDYPAFIKHFRNF